MPTTRTNLVPFAAMAALHLGCADPTSGPATTDGTGASTGEPSTTHGGDGTDAGPADGTESTGTVEPAAVELQGGVEKGPLLLGSTIVAAKLEPDGSPTGTQYLGQIDDDTGAFDLGEVSGGVYLIEAVGYHYDEVRGSLGTAPITLRAVVEVSADAGPVFVNVLTHLSHRRVLKLVAEDSAIDVAIDQAQTELTAALPIGPPGDAAGIGNATALSLLAGDSIGARYLLAVSAEVAVAALLDATPGGPVDGALQQIMNQVAEDLADDGALESSWTTILTAALLAIDAGTVEQHLAARLVELGLPAQVAALDQVLDQDRDGLVNAEDLCPTDFDPEQQDSDADGLGDPCDVLPFGEPETMAEDLDIPVALVVRPDWAYLALAGVEYYGGQIARVPTDGGALEVLVDGVNFAHELVVTDTSLFWDSGQDVWRSNLDGTDAAVFDALGGALPIGADETHLYRLGLELHRRPLAGGTDDIFGSSLYWPEDLSITDDLVVWSTLVTVESIGKDGTGHQVLSDGHNAPAMVVADDEAAYWLAGDACHLQRVDLADGTVSSLWMTDDPEIVCLVRSYPALGDGFVYWGEESRIMRVPRRGGDAEVIAVDSAESAVSWVRQLDVDATHVWWLNLAATGQPPESATGSLMRTPIP